MNQYGNQPQIDWKKIRPYLVAGIVLLCVLIFGKSTFIILAPTEKGVLFRKYTTGLNVDNIYHEGLNVIAPWNDMIIYDVSEQKLDEQMDVLSSNGLAIDMDVSVRFRPRPGDIGRLFQAFKLEYQEKLVRQELRSAVRKIIGRYTPEELYSTKREEIETAIHESTHEVLSANYVELKALLIRSVKLPDAIRQAIESKLKQEQESLAYQYRLEKEKSEAERKRIAAEGESKANEIINNSLTDKLLKMRGIEATTNLANSSNTKVVVIGNTKDGMPLILGNN